MLRVKNNSPKGRAYPETKPLSGWGDASQGHLKAISEANQDSVLNYQGQGDLQGG